MPTTIVVCDSNHAVLAIMGREDPDYYILTRTHSRCDEILIRGTISCMQPPNLTAVEIVVTRLEESKATHWQPFRVDILQGCLHEECMGKEWTTVDRLRSGNDILPVAASRSNFRTMSKATRQSRRGVAGRSDDHRQLSPRPRVCILETRDEVDGDTPLAAETAGAGRRPESW
jgi:hypothetical protein